MTQRDTGLDRLVMSRTVTPVVPRTLRAATFADAGTLEVHFTVAGAGGVGPPAVGLGKAGDAVGATLGVIAEAA